MARNFRPKGTGRLETTHQPQKRKVAAAPLRPANRSTKSPYDAGNGELFPSNERIKFLAYVWRDNRSSLADVSIQTLPSHLVTAIDRRAARHGRGRHRQVARPDR